MINIIHTPPPPSSEPIAFDSDEELYVSWYLEELRQAGLVSRWEYHTFTYELCPWVSVSFSRQRTNRRGTKTEYLTRPLLNKHVYTPDFEVYWTPEARGLLFVDLLESGVDIKSAPFLAMPRANAGVYVAGGRPEVSWSLLEVKGNAHRDHDRGSQREFSLNQKWLYQTTGLYAQKVVPVAGKNVKHSLFADTFMPDRYQYHNKAKGLRKLNFTPVTLKQYLASRRPPEPQPVQPQLELL